MNVTEFLTATSYALSGIDATVPTIGTEEANYWIATLNRKKNELYEGAKILFDSTWLVTPPNEAGTVATAASTTLTGTNTFFTDYAVGDKITVSGETVRTIATITSDTVLTVTVAFSNTVAANTFTRTTIIATAVQDYSLNRTFIAAGNQAYVTKTDATKTYFDITNPKAASTIKREVSIYGVNAKTLTFSTTLASTDDIIGGTLFVPGYYMPADVSAATDQLPLPDPYWGVMVTASEIAFGDITYEDKTEGLYTRANALYMNMVRNNRRNTYGSTKKPPTDTYQIRSAEVN